MPSAFKKPKRPDTSAQDRLMKQQQANLKRKQAEAQREADALRNQRVSSQKKARGRMAGRRSLFAGDELGNRKEKLG